MEAIVEGKLPALWKTYPIDLSVALDSYLYTEILLRVLLVDNSELIITFFAD